MVIQMIYPEYS